MIYNHNGDQLVEGFYLHGVDYINKVEGSFIIFLIDGTGFYILTDKVNSKKAFYACLENVWHVSNDIDALPCDKCQLSLDGIACYLANGFMLNDLTLFKEIRSARRACVHSYKNGEIIIYSYWEYKFSNPAYSIDQYPRFKEELISLLIESIDRRYATVSDPILSLSAGHDSRGILGILHDKIKAPNISCFSYALEELPGKDTDAALSKKLAEQCGYPHQTIRSYQGNLVDHLKNNAREGKCLSNFCGELDAWHHLAAAGQFSDVFVGDECFGRIDFKLGSKRDILASVSITDAAGIRGMKSFISKEIYTQMCTCINKLADYVYDRTKEIPDPRTKSDFLYLDQRIDHTMMPWREYFTGQVGFVHDPFLDGAVLEFMNRLPVQLRKVKFLYRNTIKEMFPDLFSVGLATSSGYRVDWHRELLKHKDELISLVQETDSRLDEIISRNEVLHVIKHYGSWILRLKEYLTKALDYLGRNKLVEKALNGLLGSWDHPRGSLVGSDKLLIRLLLIRIYLSTSSFDQ